MQLNEGQAAAVDKISMFLTNNDKVISLLGSPGGFA